MNLEALPVNSFRSFFLSLFDDAMDWCKGRSPIVRLPFLVYLGYVGVQHVRDPLYNSWFGGLIFGLHEFGHVLFSGFGEFMAVAGGSIFQLAVPLISVGMFLYQRDYFGIAVAGCWESFSLYNLATYIGDAQAMELPLLSIGGGDAYHDWEYLLVHLGMLEHDAKIATITRGIGFVVLIGSWIWGAWVCYRMARAGKSA
jgi:hypothetical protein